MNRTICRSIFFKLYTFIIDHCIDFGFQYISYQCRIQFIISNMKLTNKLNLHLDLINHHGYCDATDIFIVVVDTARSI